MTQLTHGLLETLRFEYHGELADERANIEQHGADWRDEPLPGNFYDYLLRRGWSRYQLSAYGISRDYVYIAR
jgi:hypothetical protein